MLDLATDIPKPPAAEAPNSAEEPRVRRSVMTRLRASRFTLVFLSLVLAGLSVVPVAIMLMAAFRPAGVLPLEAGPWTADSFQRMFGSPGMGAAIRNTIVFAVASVAVALPVAVVIAFLTERTDLPLRRGIYVAMFVPMTIPSFATAIGWILLLGPRSGLINRALDGLMGGGSTGPTINIYSMGGLVFVQSLGLVPSMWLLLVAVMRNMNPALEEAAATSGAGRLATFFKITFPLLRPGVAAILVFYVILGIEILELPLAIGPNAGIEVLSTRIYFSVFPIGAGTPDYAAAAAVGMVGLALGVVGITAYAWLIRNRNQFAVVAGKGYRPTRVRLGRWRWPALGFVFGFMVLKVILPLGVLIYASLLRFYQPPQWAGLPWTLDNYMRLWDYHRFGRYFVNSILVGVGAALVTLLLASMASWFVVRRPSVWTNVLNVLTFIPLAVPGTISTLAFFLIFIGTPLYGSLILLIIAFVSRYIAYTSRLMHAAQLQIHKELEEASLTSSVPPWRGFMLINIPILMPAVLNGLLFVLVHTLRDFSVALLLATAGSLLVGNLIYGQFNSGGYPTAAAMIVTLVTFNMIVVLLGRRWLMRAVEAN